ncbi:glycosyltransferase family 2 protein [Pseudomonas kilonensis]|jgi:glycosyltransferase involved in cell wall biosynthesis|uniref:glycosyltransferase family 2 protein n=1 Tax=Pseudomonas kilonensis TaxID=132476 RepID=UPI000F01D6FB
MTEMLIGVVIPAFNYARTLPRAVNSVVAQLGDAQAELLVIDDGSEDATPQVLEQLLVEHAGCFRVLRQPNGGLSSVRNRGIEESRGQYLIFLDADDEMAPGALAAVAQHISKHSESRLIIGGHWSVFPDGRRVRHSVKPLPATPRERVRGYLLDKTVMLSNGACVMHREVFGPGNYPEHLRNVEDIPVFAQVLANFPCSVLNQPLALIYKHADSMRHDLKQSMAAGVGMVDEVFSPARLPGLQDLRQAFLAQRCLSLFRDCYNAGDYVKAKDFYAQAVRADIRSLTRWPYTRKAIRLLFK